MLRDDQFISRNTNTWKDLEGLSSLISNKGIKALPSKDIKRFLHLFRQTSHHLAYARTHYPNSNVVEYLNSLVGKCHSHVYSVKKASPKKLLDYIAYGFPKLLVDCKWYFIGSFSVFLIGLIVSLLLVLSNSANALLFLPQNMVEGVKSGIGSKGSWNYPLMSSYIMVNNITVSLKAFVFGITLGIGTVYVLFFNGTMLGSLTALIYLYGNPTAYWSLILPHGIIELTAIFISGAAGFIIAKHILIPGEQSRLHSLIKGSKKAVGLIGGIIFMLIIAGIIEGFFTPLSISPIIKLTFAGITALILITYFNLPKIIDRTKVK